MILKEKDYRIAQRIGGAMDAIGLAVMIGVQMHPVAKAFLIATQTSRLALRIITMIKPIELIRE